MGKDINKKRKLNNKKLIVYLLGILLLAAILIFALPHLPSDKDDNSDLQLVSSSPKEEEIIEDKIATVSMVGDIMCHSPQYAHAYNSSTGEYDFNHVFNEIKKTLASADLTVGNLETTLAGAYRSYSGYPTFNSPDALADALKNSGFDLLTTANNHSLDSGYNGIGSTLDYLDSIGISHTGTARSVEEQNEILTQNVNDINIAFMAYTYGTNGIPVPTGKEYCVNLIDKKQILSDIQKAKDANVDMICVSIHWGQEYEKTPNATQLELEDFLFKNGVDIILGSHPHVLQPMTKKTITTNEGIEKDVFVIYSFGNFMSNQQYPYTDTSIILNLEFTKDGKTGETIISDISYVPIYMWKSATSYSGHKYLILDIEKSIADYESNAKKKVDASTYNKLKEALASLPKFDI